MKLNGSQILIECLVAHNVDTIFGYPGGAVLNIYDELYKNQDRIRHILTSHEQGASHAADGYSRATGKVGVVLATSGPGATNLVTGIATAYMDSIPMIVLTGNVTTGLLGKDSFQEIDITGITMPITKHNYIVKNINDLPFVINEAFYIAQSGRPGPVLIDIAKDVTATTIEYKPLTVRSVERKQSRIKDEDVKAVLDILANAEKPFIYAGGGIILSDASEELMEFATLLDSPTSTSMMGLGAFPQTHRLSTGLIGMHGTITSNKCLLNADVIIVLGARFSDRVTAKTDEFGRQAKIIHIDVDKAEIDKNVKTDAHIVGDLKVVLEMLNKNITKVSHQEWNDTVDSWKELFASKHFINKDLNPKTVMEALQNVKEDKIITTEVGQNQLWACQYYKYDKPRQLLTSGGLGTMGYGLGAAMGAVVGCPDKVVFHVAGDGSFRMNCNELSTVEYYNMPIITVLLNNQALGNVRQWQTSFYGARYSQTTLDRGPDFKKLAEAYFIEYFKCDTYKELEDALAKAVVSKKPTIIDCTIHIDERVLPMVAPGQPLENVIMD